MVICPQSYQVPERLLSYRITEVNIARADYLRPGAIFGSET